MASTTDITNNNNKSIKEIIGEVIITQNTEPDHIYSALEYEICYEHNFKNFRITNIQPPSNVISYHADDAHIVSNPNEICVYKKNIYCSLTDKVISASNIFHVEEKIISSLYKIKHYDNNFEDYNKIPVIWCGNFSQVHFAFNIIDVRAAMFQFIMVNNWRRRLNQSCIPTEVIEYILPFVDILKINKNGDIDESPLNYKCQYNFDFPKIVSKAQIKKLFDLGMINMIMFTCYHDSFLRGSRYEEFAVLSDKGFDNEPAFQQRFGSKEKMHEFIQDIMQKHF
jgi:hypothetical protein